MSKFFGCIGLFVMAVAVIVISIIANGWALTMLWGWFVVPLFNLPPLSIPYAIGIALIVKMLTNHSTSSDDKEKDISEIIASIIGILLSPITLVLFGWIVHSFIR